jgi:hypothetical protein
MTEADHALNKQLREQRNKLNGEEKEANTHRWALRNGIILRFKNRPSGAPQ